MSSKQGFLNRFPELVQDIIDDIKSTGMPQEAIDWTKKVSHFKNINIH
jgi:hypothetical protein